MEKHSYLGRSNLEYIESLYQTFLKKPEAIEGDWRLFFEGVDFAKNLRSGEDGSTGLSSKELDVYNLIRAYRDYGHFEANLNPLSTATKSFPELSFDNFNLTEADLDSRFEIGAIIGKSKATLREIIEHLRKSYCRTLSVQIAENMPTVRNWFIERFEREGESWQLSAAEKKEILDQLARTESFEKFLHTRYVGKKRFSVEGGDSLIPMLERLAVDGVKLGMEEIVIGMAHRGRLNVLRNFIGKETGMIFAEFDGVKDENNSFFDGDVKYHLGYSADKKTPHGACHISLAYNPSHLEAVNPVVLGMARAKQRRRRDTSERKRVVPVLIHGDAAFAGQGVVAETLQMSQLRAYTVGGAIHIVIDNQVGFTTSPENDRSSPYASDIAKILQTPVLHANGDDVESCVRAMNIAIRFRQEFKRDVVINMICYRRYGHNEGDEPAFTQPVMYEKIKKHPTLFEIYSKKLEAEGVVAAGEAEKVFKGRIDELQSILEETRKSPPKMKPMAFEGFWRGFRRAEAADFQKETDTSAPAMAIKEVAKLATSYPEGFNVNPKLEKILEGRRKMMDGDGKIDWGMAEMLAYGTLLREGTPVRIVGQDCVRGTFSHRHAMFYDMKTGAAYNPYASIRPEEVEFVIYDSLLSEYAAMGFEYGNSSSDPTFLTIWEAQFGDFVNGAQIIIDQFLSSAEQKWQRMSGLVLFLPHGYEGQGPEHSSARLERFLQLCAQDNMQVCNMTTPAQIFHALRRQMKRDFRKPLIVMSPKSLLRHPRVISSIDDLAKGAFQEVIADPVSDKKAVETLILCSGKVYYDILAEKEELGGKAGDGFAIARTEQLYPWPEHRLAPLLKGYPKLKKIVWAQEEPKNMGSWFFVAPRLMELVQSLGLQAKVEYVGRTERASPATGSEKVHQAEQKEITRACFGLKADAKGKAERAG